MFSDISITIKSKKKVKLKIVQSHSNGVQSAVPVARQEVVLCVFDKPFKREEGRAARIHRGGDVLNLKWFLLVFLLRLGKKGVT